MATSTAGPSFIETSSGRQLLLRGLNLSGQSKFPIGQPSHLLDGFWEGAESGDVSFIGRPFSGADECGGSEWNWEEEANEHFGRITGWGFNFLRWPITWEALEHEGPGKYDEEFIDHTISLLRLASQHSLKVFIDPHQDVWSRFSGGDGAPYWTLPLCGLNPRSFTATQAALIHSEYVPNEKEQKSSGSKFPPMIWSTNYTRLANQTMFTLFFGGERYAPRCTVNGGENVQHFLQRHFIQAFQHLAKRISEQAPELLDETIIGWDSINEPSNGLIGYQDLNLAPDRLSGVLVKGTRPTPFEAFKLGVGQAQEVDFWIVGALGPRKEGRIRIDPGGESIWASSSMLGEDPSTGYNAKYGWTRDPSWKVGGCVWALHDVWDPTSGELKQPFYFADCPASPTNATPFSEQFWKPHFVQWVNAIRTFHPNALAFLNMVVFHPPPPSLLSPEAEVKNLVYAPHYYDGLTLINRHFSTFFNADALGLMRGKYASSAFALRLGLSNIRKCLRQQMGYYLQDVKGGMPCLLGEIGIPMDMDNDKAYEDGDFSQQILALDASLNSADGTNVLNWTMWNYSCGNIWEWGDGWCVEDLSAWGLDDYVADGEVDLEEMATLQSSTSCSAQPKPRLSLSIHPDVLQTHARDGSTLSALSDYPPQPNSALSSKAALIKNPAPFARKGTMDSEMSLRDIDVSVRSVGAMPDASLPSLLDSKPSLTQIRRRTAAPRGIYRDLVQGARAPQAFSRPYPVLIVGRVKSIEFDVGKAEVEIRVVVSTEAIVKGQWSTEIYLPVIHFGKDELVYGPTALDKATDCQEPDGDSPVKEDEDDDSLPPTPIGADDAEDVDDDRNTGSGSGSGSTLMNLSTLSMQRASKLKNIIAEAGDVLQLTINASHGSTRVAGQYLFWDYPIPTSGEAEYTLKVARTGGAIKLQPKPRKQKFVAARMGEKESEKNICERLADLAGGCHVM